MNDGDEARYSVGSTPVWGRESERIIGLIERQLRKYSSTPDEDLERIRDDAGRVFARCAPVAGPASRESQLVVGRVQAGKTSNFTVVTGLARDGGYQLFIVLAGTKSELLEQTLRRLKKTLAAGSATSLPAFWVQKLTIGNEDALASELRTKLAALKNPATSSGQAPVLVVLKQDDNLLALQSVLERLDLMMPLQMIPTMIIDDEADQASPDTNTRRATSTLSAIHAAIAGVRERLPWHTFLAYTATPQANLLMELNGLLHPRYVTVIASGGDYVGVEELFGPSEVPYATEVLDTPPQARRAPDSLKAALATLLCQVVLVRRYREEVLAQPLRGSDEPLCVTMLLNPGSTTADHDVWRELADTVLDAWAGSLADSADLGAAKIIEEYIKPAWIALKAALSSAGMGSGVPHEPSEADIAFLAELIPFVERRTINSVTARAGVRLPEDEEWNHHVAWLCVGGDILGRGQTLVNLMTTYMPRPAGLGAIDTIQQRGRFYGYHSAYRPLLRGWFEPDTLQMYKDAADSETALLSSLSDLDADAAPLAEWTRALLLGTGRLRATRRSVVPLSAREFTHREWAFSQAFILDSDVNVTNLGLIQDLLGEVGDRLVAWPDDARSDRRNLTTTVSMTRFLELLNLWSAAGPEVQSLADLSLTLGRLDDQSEDSEVAVVFMDRSPDKPRDVTVTAYRSLQGSRSASASRDRIGNPLGQTQRAIVDPELVTAQFHVFRVGDTPNELTNTIMLTDCAPALVVHLPEAYRQRVLAFNPRP